MTRRIQKKDIVLFTEVLFQFFLGLKIFKIWKAEGNLEQQQLGPQWACFQARHTLTWGWSHHRYPRCHPAGPPDPSSHSQPLKSGFSWGKLWMLSPMQGTGLWAPDLPLTSMSPGCLEGLLHHPHHCGCQSCPQNHSGGHSRGHILLQPKTHHQICKCEHATTTTVSHLLSSDQEREERALTCSISSCASFTKSTLFVSVSRAAALLSRGEKSEALESEEKPSLSHKTAKGNQHTLKSNFSYYTLCLDRGLKRLFNFTTRRNKTVSWCLLSNHSELDNHS